MFWYVFAFLATVFFIKILCIPARCVGLVDIPAGRKDHQGEIPLIGGLAIFFAVMLAVFFQEPLRLSFISIFPSAALIVIIGVCDDKSNLTPGIRLLAQMASSLLAIYLGDLSITHLGDLFGRGPVSLGRWSVSYTVFCMVGIMNAVNMLDGIDGLAGGVVLADLLLFGLVALLGGHGTQAALIFLVASSVIGFTVFNMRTPWRPRASVFMGDAGSMMLGFLLAWFAMALSAPTVDAIAPITTVWILGIPILDTVGIMLRRMLKGRSPFAPDREHLHHFFLRAGFSVTQTTLLIVSLSTALGLIGIGAWVCGIPDYVMTYSFIALSLVYLCGFLYAWRREGIVADRHE